MMVRDGPHDDAPLEVLMVRRNLRSEFVGGAYVFPGGAVDATDRGDRAERCSEGRSDADASAILGLPSGGLSYWVAALRECFEEAGVLLAYQDEQPHVAGTEERARRSSSTAPHLSASPAPGARSAPGEASGERGRTLLSMGDPTRAARYAEHRAAINREDRQFLDVCSAEGVLLAVDRVHYFAHWITPEGAPRRYDTRFFVAVAPPDQSPADDRGETIAAEWVRPADALARHRQGDIELIFPTIRNLQAIGRFATVDELIAAAESAVHVPTMLPRVVADGNGVRILLPGDSGYHDAEASQQAARSSAGAGAGAGGGAGAGAGAGAGGGAGGGAGAGGAIPGGRTGGGSSADFNDVVRALSIAANPEDQDAADVDLTTGVAINHHGPR